MRGVALILKKVQVIKLDKKDLKFKGLCVLGKKKKPKLQLQQKSSALVVR